MPTDAEIRDAAVAELKLTTAGWRKPNGNLNYPSGEAPMTTHWGKAMASLKQIGIVPEPEPEPEPPPSGITPIYVADFETGDFSQGNITLADGSKGISQQESSPGRITLIPAVFPGGGEWSAKVLIGPSDVGISGAGGSTRTEMMFTNIAQAYGWNSLQGKHTWITWNLWYDLNFEWPPSNSWMLNTQFWSTGTSTGSPVFEINSPGGIQYVSFRGGRIEDDSNFRINNLGPAQRGFLYRYKVHHLWSSGSGGLIEVWRNGVKVVNGDTRPNCAVGHEGVPTFKCGTYGGVHTRDSYTVHDNIKFWTADPGPAY